MGGHDLFKTVRALREDLGYEYTPDEINGRLRVLAFHGLAMLVGRSHRNRQGWQATEKGRQVAVEVEPLMFRYAVMQAHREGDGLAKVVFGDRVLGYAVTPQRYENMADDPTLGLAVVDTVSKSGAVEEEVSAE